MRRPTPAPADAADSSPDPVDRGGDVDEPVPTDRRSRRSGRGRCRFRRREDPRRAGHPAGDGDSDAPAGCAALAPRSPTPSAPERPDADDGPVRLRDVWRPPAPAARRCAPRSAASRCRQRRRRLMWVGGRGIRRPARARHARRRLQPALRRRADQGRRSEQLDPTAVESGARRPGRHPAAARRRERGQGGAGDLPPHRVVHARGAPAARARRAHRRAHADRADPDARRLHARRCRRRAPCRRRRRPRPALPCSPSRAAPARRPSRRSGW